MWKENSCLKRKTDSHSLLEMTMMVTNFNKFTADWNKLTPTLQKPEPEKYWEDSDLKTKN
jgi:hypothetical protein